MRRPSSFTVPLALALSLGGCNYVGDPYDGFRGFIGDTVSLRTNPNRPVGDAANMLRVSGADAATEPLLPEAGNIWPGPLPPPRSMYDLQREPVGQQSSPPPDLPGRPVSRGSSTPPGAAPMPPQARPLPLPSGNAAAPPPPLGRVLQTPGGPVTTTIGGNGVETFIQPTGQTGVVINNGNGTSTLIGTDGSSTTVPARR